MRWLTVLLVTALLPLASLGNFEPEPRQSGPVFHVTVPGDLECLQDVRLIQAMLEEATKAQAPLVVLELGGNASRLDLTWTLGKTIRESKTPVAVFLADTGDKIVGPGQLCLGVLAGTCFMQQGMSIRGIANDPGLAALAPEPTAWSAISAELYEWVQKAVARKSVPDELAAALVSPTRPLWAVFTTTPLIIATERPDKSADAAPLVTDVRGTFQLTLDAKTSQRLGLINDLQPSCAALLTKLNIKTTAKTERTIATGLAQATKQVAPLIDRADGAEDKLKTILKLPAPPSKGVAGATYRDAAARAQPLIKDAESALADLEHLMQEYPELVRRPAPDQVEVTNKPSAFAARWRSMLQTRKDRLAKLAETAAKFAQAKD